MATTVYKLMFTNIELPLPSILFNNDLLILPSIELTYSNDPDFHSVVVTKIAGRAGGRVYHVKLKDGSLLYVGYSEPVIVHNEPTHL